MPRIGTRKLAGAAVAAALLILPATGMSCGYHGMLGNGFSSQHPRSIHVALALRDAADAGVLDLNQLKPKLADMLALSRAARRLEHLRSSLQRLLYATPVPSFSLLLVESGMWSDFMAESGAMRLKVHADGPMPDRAVVITGDAVLAAIASGRLSSHEALRSGLVVVDGPPALASSLSAALLPHLEKAAHSR
jgi:hypothetical protein